MSSGSPPTTYIPEPAAPTVTTSKTPQEDYDYATNLLTKLEDERKAIQQRTWDELTARRKSLGEKEETSYRESMPTDEPDYTAGLDPYLLNTVATNVYTSGAQASMEDLASRREREYTPVAGYDAPMFGADAETTVSSAAPPAPLTQKQKADRLLSSFIGAQGDVTGKAIGAPGVLRAIEYGYTPEQIRSKAQEEGMAFGELAAGGLQAAGFDVPLAGASQAPAPAPAPASGLKPWTAPRSTSAKDITSHINVGGKASAGYMGAAAVQRAKAAGLSSAQIKQQAAAKGLKFGPNVSL